MPKPILATFQRAWTVANAIQQLPLLVAPGFMIQVRPVYVIPVMMWLAMQHLNLQRATSIQICNAIRVIQLTAGRPPVSVMILKGIIQEITDGHQHAVLAMVILLPRHLCTLMRYTRRIAQPATQMILEGKGGI
jgi:hypothetical protein